MCICINQAVCCIYSVDRSSSHPLPEMCLGNKQHFLSWNMCIICMIELMVQFKNHMWKTIWFYCWCSCSSLVLKWFSQFKRKVVWSTGSPSVFSHLIWFRCLKHTICHVLKAAQYLVVFSEGKTNLMKIELMKVGRGRYCRLVLNNLGRWSWVAGGLGWWIILSHPLASPCPLPRV